MPRATSAPAELLFATTRTSLLGLQTKSKSGALQSEHFAIFECSGESCTRASQPRLRQPHACGECASRVTPAAGNTKRRDAPRKRQRARAGERSSASEGGGDRKSVV